MEDQLLASLPELDSRKLQQLVPQVYQNLTDVLLESLKGYTMSMKALERRVKFHHMQSLLPYFQRHQSVACFAPHYCNWEWGALRYASEIKHKPIGIYKPLSNRFIDRYVKAHRSRFGLELVPMSKIARYMEAHKNETCIYLFMADQNPSTHHQAIWIEFLGQPTACINGLEKLSQYHQLPVFFHMAKRIRRGMYETYLRNIAEPSTTPPKITVTEQCMLALETILKLKPANWLWTHKRWKFTPPPNFQYRQFIN